MAQRHAPGPRHVLVVVDDGSVDGTAAAASAILADAEVANRVIHVDERTSGGARRAGIRVAAELLGTPHDRSWVLSTDADTVVPSDWICRYLDHAAGGAVAVAGVVTLQDGPDADAIRDIWWADYSPGLAADGTHGHVHSANLGVRLDVLDAVGGMPALAYQDDRELWRRLRAAEVPTVADAHLQVATSARLDARVPEGFAHALRRLDAARA